MNKPINSKLWSLLLVLIALVTGSATAAAEDLGELELDIDYELSNFKSYEGYFIPTSSGKLTYSDMLTPYSDAAHENVIEGNWEGYSGGTSKSSIQVTEGKTIYFYTSFITEGGNFRLEMNKPFSTDFISLDEGQTLICSGRGAIEIKMSDKPTFTSVIFECDGNEYDWTNITSVRQEKYLVVEYSSTLLDIIQANPELCGKDCRIVFSGLRVDNNGNDLYNSDGVLSLNYVVGDIPTLLVSENLTGASIDSWFSPSEDKGVFTFTFTNPIKNGSIFMGYGASVEDDNYYSESPAMTIDGCNVIVDLRGTQRRLDEQTDEYGNPCQFYFKLQSFIDVNGNYIYSTDAGSLGSLSFNVPYNKLNTDLTTEFTPAAESNLANADEIEIYFTPATGVTFEGVKLTWSGNPAGLVIGKDEMNVEYDDYDGCAITFAVPAEAKNAKNVQVKVIGLETPDGQDYSEYLSVLYNIGDPGELSITLINPADGSELPGFVSEQSQIQVLIENAPTDAEALDICARIYDPAYEDPIYTAFLWAATPEEGEEYYNYSQTIYENIDFLAGVDYTINITVDKLTSTADGGRDFEQIASVDFTIHGTASAYVYSEAALVGINPDPATTDIISTDQNIITLTFDAPVNVTKAGTAIGMGAGLSQWTATKANEEGSVWTIEIPTSVIENSKSSFGVSFWAVDAEGNPVYKSTVEGIPSAYQNKENTYFNFSYVCTVGAPDFVVSPANDSELEVLDKIYVSYSLGIDPNWNNTLPITLYKGKGTNQEMIQEWAPDYFDMWNDDVCVEYGENNLKWCIKLDEAITEPGYYTFVFPNAFFNLGSEFNQASSRITNVHYIIPEPVVDLDYVITNPAVDSEVTSLKTIDITWIDAADASVNYNVTEPIVLYNANNDPVCNASIDMSTDWNDPWNMLIITLDEEVKAEGTYTLHIPAGKVLLNDGFKESSEQNLTYIVKPIVTSVNNIAVEAGFYYVYNLQGVLVMRTDNVNDLKTLAPAVYVINGNKVRIIK